MFNSLCFLPFRIEKQSKEVTAVQKELANEAAADEAISNVSYEIDIENAPPILKNDCSDV